MLKDGWRSSPFGWSKEKGWWSDDKTPNAHVREILHLMRPILLQSEPTNYMRVLNIISRRMESDGVRTILNRWKNEFNQKESQKLYRIAANELVLNSDNAFFLWLNAFEYHRDKGKQKDLEYSLGTLPFDVAKNIFINGIVEKIIAITRLAKFIWDLVHRSKGESVRIINGKYFD